LNKTEEINEWLSRQLVLRGSWITIEFYPELVQVFDKALACQSIYFHYLLANDLGENLPLKTAALHPIKA